MGKRYDSPNKRYTGYVIMPDYYDWPEIISWDDNVYEAAQLQKKQEAEPDKREKVKLRMEIMATQAKGMMPMVLEWHIIGIPEKPEKLPATPGKEAAEFHYWLMNVINSIISGKDMIDPFLSSD